MPPKGWSSEFRKGTGFHAQPSACFIFLFFALYTLKGAGRRSSLVGLRPRFDMGEMGFHLIDTVPSRLRILQDSAPHTMVHRLASTCTMPPVTQAKDIVTWMLPAILDMRLKYQLYCFILEIENNAYFTVEIGIAPCR